MTSGAEISGTAPLEDEGDAGSGGLLAGGGDDGVVVELDVAEETMLGVGAAVEVEDDAVTLDGHRGDDDAVAGSGGLALLVDHLPVVGCAGAEGAVGVEGEAGAHGEGAVCEALLGVEVADELAATAFVRAGRWAGEDWWG